ncbi:caspase family protein, partial [Okeania sp. SIO2G5]|uniref:caspase family protein n=1 Tax=Okeania sp. SIO2G5 TaxID=2607796 RepID=UPI0013C07C32
MSNYWAIAIGINQYKNFQPLLYAQWDAQALWTYWVREGGIPHTQCMLLTDSATPDQGASARTSAMQPTKKTIEQQLVEWGHHRVGPDDTLWCFFSGYGLSHQGKDYLMPLDGDPNNIEQTGIAADAFFTTLKAAPANRIVVLLDLKRWAKGDVSAADPLAANTQAPEYRVGD